MSRTLHADARLVHLQFGPLGNGGVEIGLADKARCERLAEQYDVAQTRGRGELELARIATPGEIPASTAQALDEIHGVRHRVGGHDGDQVAVVDDVAEFARLVAGIDRHDDRTAEGDGKQRLDELEARVHEDADVVAAAHAQRLQAARAAQGARASSA
jgi:hypothetical protein